MSESTTQQLVQLTQRLLDSIARRDWAAYQELCDPSLSAFEPEACGSLVEGLEFHRYYFQLDGPPAAPANTICAPHVRPLGTDAAIVSYVRLVQSVDSAGRPATHAWQETRVWQRQQGQWRHVHFHRSAQP